jgi:hypothetical protein
MTSAKSFQAKVHSFEKAIPLNGNHHIFRTGWVKTAATWKQGGYENLI